MGNPLQDYGESLGKWMEFVPTTMPAPFEKQPNTPGIQLGPEALLDDAVRWPFAKYAHETGMKIWTNVPPNIRALMIDRMSELVNKWASNIDQFAANIDLSLVNAGSGVASALQYLQAAFDFSKAVAAVIHKTLEDNDNSRRKERLKLLEMMAEDGPRGWAGGLFLARTYKRTTKSWANPAGTDSYPLIWPPDYTGDYGAIGPLTTGNPPPYREGDCGRGSGDFSGGLDSSCRGFMQINPLWFPVWCTASLGSYQKSLRGMERSSDSGRAVWAQMLAMQSALLSDPASNLQTNGYLLNKRYQYFKDFFWKRYFNPPPYTKGDSPPPKGLQNISIDSDEKAWLVTDTFDPEFRPFGDKRSFYLTPSGMIGAYNEDGTGTTDHPDLKKVGVYRWDRTATHASFGNWITAADYNTITAATGQFFSLRMGILRDRPMTKTIKEEFPDFLQKITRPVFTGMEETQERWLVPERKVRRAIVASAEGAVAEQRVIITGKEISPKFEPKRVTPADVLPQRAPKEEGGHRTSALPLIAGGVLAAVLLKGRR